MSIDKLEGSESRDKFKKYHKQADNASGARRRLACDIDFALASKQPEPNLAAIFDYKQPHDNGLTDSEAFIYNDLINHYPLYLVNAKKCVVQTPIQEQLFNIDKVIDIQIEQTAPDWYEVKGVKTERIKSDIPWGGAIQNENYFTSSGMDGVMEWEDKIRFNDL